MNIKENELRQHLHDVEQEQEQVAACNPSRAIELEGEVQRLTQIINGM